MKNKHNKKKNSAFLFEVLIREISNSFQTDLKRAQIGKLLLKHYFSKSSSLRRELSLYEDLVSTRELSLSDASSILMEVKKERSKLSNGAVEEQLLDLSRKIKKFLGKEVFEQFIPNYKTLATINQIFSSNVSPKQKVFLEKELLSRMTSKEQEKKELEPIDNIVVRSFVKKFNEKYGNLQENQKMLLNKFASSIGDNVDLLMFMEKQIKIIKESLKNALNTRFKNDAFMSPKIEKVLLEMEGFKSKKIDEEMVKKVLKAQTIVGELSK